MSKIHAKENVDEIGAKLEMPPGKPLACLAQQMDTSASSAQSLMQMLHRQPYKTTVRKFYERL
jgi:hypothetical protein